MKHLKKSNTQLIRAYVCKTQTYNILFGIAKRLACYKDKYKTLLELPIDELSPNDFNFKEHILREIDQNGPDQYGYLIFYIMDDDFFEFIIQFAVMQKTEIMEKIENSSYSSIIQQYLLKLLEICERASGKYVKKSQPVIKPMTMLHDIKAHSTGSDEKTTSDTGNN